MGKPKKQKTKSANGTGSLWTDPRDGSLYGVVTWIENHPVTGKPRRCRRMRKAVSGNKTEAYQHVRDLLAELNLGGAAHIDARKVTLADLARHHFEHHLTPVERDADGVKRSGLASWEDRRRMCQLAVDYFGPQKLITTITAAEVRRYRLHRLKVPLQANYRVGPADENGVRELHQDTRKDPETGQPKVRSITTVHKEIGTLRRMLNHAVEEGWLPLGNPIGGKKGTGLINPAEEPKQTVTASTDEEKALLDQCDHPRRRHLKPYLIACFDTGCRSIELRRLQVRDLNFEDPDGTFEVYSDKPKVRTWRAIIMTPRLREALIECCKGKKPEHYVFTYGKHYDRMWSSAPKTSWRSAKRDAKFWSDDKINLEAFTGHGMRHTMITRAIQGGASIAEVGKYAGHEQESTLWRYVHPDDGSRRRIASIVANHKEATVVNFPAAKKRRTARAS